MLRSPADVQRLAEGIAQLEVGDVIEVDVEWVAGKFDRRLFLGVVDLPA